MEIISTIVVSRLESFIFSTDDGMNVPAGKPGSTYSINTSNSPAKKPDLQVLFTTDDSNF